MLEMVLQLAENGEATETVTLCAVVSPLLTTFRLVLKVPPVATDDAPVEAESSSEGGSTMSKLLVEACCSVHPLLTLTDTVWALAVDDALTVVQLTLVAPPPMLFDVSSPSRLHPEQPEKLMVPVAQLPVQPVASTTKVLSFMTSSLSAPDWVTDTDRAADALGTRIMHARHATNAVIN
jgi:hypothetical protein